MKQHMLGDDWGEKTTSRGQGYVLDASKKPAEKGWPKALCCSDENGWSPKDMGIGGG